MLGTTIPRNFLALMFLFLIFGERLASQDASEPQQSIQGLIADLSSDDYATRAASTSKLVKIGLPAAKLLETVAIGSESAETRERARLILNKLPPSHRWPEIPAFDKSRLREIQVKGGEVASNEEWSGSHSYLLTSDLNVKSGATLRIAPGTVVLIRDGVSIAIDETSRLVAESSEHTKPIVITSETESIGKPGHWGRITVHGGLSLKNAQIRRSSGVYHAGDPNTEMGFHDVGIYETSGNALVFNGHRSNHGEVTIRKCTGAGIFMERVPTSKTRRGVTSPNPFFSAVTIADASKGIVTSSGAYPVIQQLSISRIENQGIESADGMVKAEKVEISACKIGISIADKATGEFGDVAISRCTVGVQTSMSGPRFKSLTLTDIKENGIETINRSSLMVVELNLARIAGIGVLVKEESQTLIDSIRADDSVSRATEIENGSRISEGAAKAMEPRVGG